MFVVYCDPQKYTNMAFNQKILLGALVVALAGFSLDVVKIQARKVQREQQEHAVRTRAGKAVDCTDLVHALYKDCARASTPPALVRNIRCLRSIAKVQRNVLVPLMAAKTGGASKKFKLRALNKMAKELRKTCFLLSSNTIDSSQNSFSLLFRGPAYDVELARFSAGLRTILDSLDGFIATCV